MGGKRANRRTSYFSILVLSQGLPFTLTYNVFCKGEGIQALQTKGDDKETEESKLSQFDSNSLYSLTKMLHSSHKYGQLLLQVHQQGFF